MVGWTGMQRLRLARRLLRNSDEEMRSLFVESDKVAIGPNMRSTTQQQQLSKRKQPREPPNPKKMAAEVDGGESKRAKA